VTDLIVCRSGAVLLRNNGVGIATFA